jgi:hypothetical protein
MTRLDVEVVAVVAWLACEGCLNLYGRVVGGHGGSASSALRQGRLVNGQGPGIFFVLRAWILLVLEGRWWV